MSINILLQHIPKPRKVKAGTKKYITPVEYSKIIKVKIRNVLQYAEFNPCFFKFIWSSRTTKAFMFGIQISGTSHLMRYLPLCAFFSGKLDMSIRNHISYGVHG